MIDGITDVMIEAEISKRDQGILDRTKAAHKTYKFDEAHNPRMPAEYWFQHTIEGNTLFIVFYTQACRYSKCEGCNLPSKMSLHHVGFKDIMRQIYVVFHNILSADDKKTITKIIVSNNGSVLDQETFSTTALIYLIAKINLHCASVKTVTLETRPEYVEIEELEVLVRALQEGDVPSSLELAIGFEAYDNNIRNDLFLKGLTNKRFETLLLVCSDINARHYRNNKHNDAILPIKIKTYFMQKPIPEISEEDAIVDIQNGIDYLHQMAQKYMVEINMHLNPTYVAIGTPLEDAFNAGTYTPPLLRSVVEAVKYGDNKAISIFVGLNDEDLTVPGGSFIRDTEEDVKLVKILDQFNYTQDYNLLRHRCIYKIK